MVFATLKPHKVYRVSAEIGLPLPNSRDQASAGGDEAFPGEYMGPELISY